MKEKKKNSTGERITGIRKIDYRLFLLLNLSSNSITYKDFCMHFLQMDSFICDL